jgi:PhnB protein
MTKVNPYLNFNGNCEEAFNFYKSVFGGEFITIMKFKDVPSEVPSPESASERIMHVALPISGETVIMGSDAPEIYETVISGTNFSISISTDSEEETSRLYNGLSTGGKATMALSKTFWGAYFGMLTDKFGINWMVSYDESPQK